MSNDAVTPTEVSDHSSTTTTTTPEVKFTSTKLSSYKSVSHLQKYPLLNDAKEFLLSFSLISILSNYIVLTILQIENLINFKSIDNLTTSIDNFIDSYILTNLIDKYFPKLSQLSVSNINSTFLNYYNKLIDNVKNYLIFFKKNLTNYVSPYMSPVNDNFEKIINNYLPEENTTSAAKEKLTSLADSVTPAAVTSENTDEIDRLYSLATKAYDRSLPIIEQKKTQLTTLPNELSTKLSETSSKLSETSKKLSVEAYENLEKTYDSRIKPTIEKLTSNFVSVTESTKDKIDETVNDITNQIPDEVANDKIEITKIKNGFVPQSSTTEGITSI
ncbi:hypothetical protein B5S31_g1078 [[Candida] boidinii]|uniref:Unnamed protein product n=1 Tax=Candida boidinii TaxID=5477 RepID=A0ACB5U1M9_CANBO|nr:hypothetical protein B5S31_g1078 [[Candida] boidinii]OWB76607.1 hypothetical protein B5S32_g760 [[Candida] boidinii]GME99193.1 unnamed protein product [[Candida] boidinii]